MCVECDLQISCKLHSLMFLSSDHRLLLGCRDDQAVCRLCCGGSVGRAELHLPSLATTHADLLFAQEPGPLSFEQPD